MRRGSSEEGVTIIIVALVMSGLLGVAALALDLGQQYASHRQMQNAADAAALAATRALHQLHLSNTPGTVGAAALAIATANGATSMPSCDVIANDAPRTRIGACDDPTAVGNATASGVRVSAAVSNTTSFAGLFGVNTTTSGATSAATIQPVGGVTIVCQGPSANAATFNLMAGPNTNLPSNDLVVPTNVASFNLGALWPVLPSPVGGVCSPATSSNPNSKGTDMLLVGAFDRNTNVSKFSGTAALQVANQPPCDFIATPCKMVVPVVDDGSSNCLNGFCQYRAEAFVVLSVTSVNGNYLASIAMTGTDLTAGPGTLGVCAPGAACVIKLVT